MSIGNYKKEAWKLEPNTWSIIKKFEPFRVFRDFRAAGSSGARVRFVELGNPHL